MDNFDESNISTHYRGSYGPPCTHKTMNENIPGAGRHQGIDIGVVFGTPVKAIADGIIDPNIRRNLAGDDRLKENENGGWGGLVIVRHNCLGGVYSVYAHLSDYSPEIWKQKETAKKTEIAVKKGDIIGYSGGTGLWRGNSTGNHLHFQIDRPGNQRIPWSFSWPKWVKEEKPFEWWYRDRNKCQEGKGNWSPVNIPDDWQIYDNNDNPGGPYYSEKNRKKKEYPTNAVEYYSSIDGQVLDYTYDPIAFISSGGMIQ